jgi:hypothetical protein
VISTAVSFFRTRFFLHFFFPNASFLIMNLVQLPLTPKIGNVPADTDKYLSWSGKHGYYQRPVTSGASLSYKTDKMLSPAFTSADLSLNRTINTRLMQRNKSLVEFKGQIGGGGAKLMSRSNSVESYTHFSHHIHLLHDFGGEEAFRKSFEKFLRAKPHMPGTEVVALHELELLVKVLLIFLLFYI